MPVETASFFSQVIEDHVELKRRNSAIEGALPIDRYRNGDPFENHPLFKTEEQARIEETMGGEEPAVVAHIQPWPGEERIEEEDSLWGRTRPTGRPDAARGGRHRPRALSVFRYCPAALGLVVLASGAPGRSAQKPDPS